MKFATLIALTSVAAIRLTQKATEGPSAADVIEMCDKDGDDMLSKPEVMSCIDKFVKNKKHNKEAKAMVNKHWKQVAGKDDKVSEAELEKAMDEHSELAQKKGKKPKKDELAQKKGKKGGKKPKKDDHSDEEEGSEDEHSEDEEKEHRPKKGDHSDDEEESEEEHEPKELAEHSPAEMAEGLIAHCDKGDKDGQLTKAEALGCGCPAKMADAIFGEGGADVNGDGKLSKAEIEGMIKKMMKRGGPPALAENNVDTFIEHCDKGDKDGELTKAEVIGCGIPRATVNRAWPHIDKDGNGKVSKAELEAVFGTN